MDRAERRTVPFGAWPSPLSPDALTRSGHRPVSEPAAAAGRRYWLEQRPEEGGRQALMLRHLGRTVEMAPGMSIRSRVHEYGGGAYLPVDHLVYAVDDATQRVVRIEGPGTEPVPISAEPANPRSVRWADLTVTPDRRWLVGVRETHTPGGRSADVRNELVALRTDGSGDERVLSVTADFVSSPRVSPRGDHLAWVSWDHPAMPWDSSRLWTAYLGEDLEMSEPAKVAGGPGESVCHPTWAAAGTLYFVSDRTGWWLPYRWDGTRTRCAVDHRTQAEFASPQWVFRDYRYCIVGEGSIVGEASIVGEGAAEAGVGSDDQATGDDPALGDDRAASDDQATGDDPVAGDYQAGGDVVACCYTAGGRDRLALVVEGGLQDVDTGPYEVFSHLWPVPGGFVAVAGGPTEPSVVVEVDLRPGDGRPRPRPLSDRGHPLVGPEWISVPERASFPRADGSEAYGLFYGPKNPLVEADGSERPPLVVLSHGGPTAAFRALLDLKGVQFYTSRGFAVLQVDYGGSSGYGRPYRELLDGNWGVLDVDDCVAAARWATANGRADGERVAVRGSSAGGYTTLCALTFTDSFAVGASYYGIGDAAALAADTHKFESRYLDKLIGPYPQMQQTYAERSPVAHTELLSTPVILFQGVEDRVVPPEQAEAMAAALAAKGVRYRLLTFEGEGHGFRQSDTQRRCMEAELEFFGEVLGFQPADVLADLPVDVL